MSHRARVLVIDDDPLFRSVISSLLRSDYVVRVASDGSEGFFRALEEPPDVAIIDVRMPIWDGLRTLKAFRAHPSLGDVRIVMLTAHADGRTLDAAIRAGADDYVLKTKFGPDEFLRKLARLLPESFGANGAAGGGAANVPSPAANGPARAAARGTGNGRQSTTADRAWLQAILDDWE